MGVLALGRRLGNERLIELLVQSEWEYRENQKITRCLNNAAFRYQAFMDNIDYSPARKLDKNLIIASQLPYEKWYDVITEKSIADAIMDRLINSSHRITLSGESMRKKK